MPRLEEDKKFPASYFSGSEQPLVIGRIDMGIFEPAEFTRNVDKYENPISKIMFPDFFYNMVHHPMKHYTRQSANIYKERDCFVRVNAYRPESDIQMHEITVLTPLGDFNTGWGDGDIGSIYFPDAIKDVPEFQNAFDDVKRVMHENYSHEQDDCEAAFITLAMYVLHMHVSVHPDFMHQIWFDKISWEAKKRELEEARLQYKKARYRS
jgi:hypothetical protein